MLKICEICLRDWETTHGQSRKRTCNECAKACAICGGTHKACGLCGAHHMQYIRAGKPPLRQFIDAVKAGQQPGRVIRECEMCGAEFNPYGPEVCCSEECHDERKRQRNREYKRAEYWQKWDMLRVRQKSYRKKHGQAQDKRKHARIMADPERHERVKKKSREWYRRNAERVQQRRRELEQLRLERMTPEQREAYRERLREYGREWHAKRRLNNSRTDYDRRYRRNAAKQKLVDELIAAMSALKERPQDAQDRID